MRSWDKYCEDTEKAFKHFRDCISLSLFQKTTTLGYPVSYLFNKSKSIDNA